ncbi:ABC transporter substrate-binding protein [Luteimicrobium album]|uniref:ABC transporter substrate-binding protein n=1 Tax=Luteimicrobium album TaxID=1054550 RepID=A0ABQ6I1U3_9MICO|nr:ABC transporter substrate-binding protein [Luteimicrobium album]GMA24442.1 ABC transporter substrate-binding protein [Luteimicrobium album]
MLPPPGRGARPRGNLVYLEAENWCTFSPNLIGCWQNNSVANNALDRLVYENPDTLEYEPWLAKSFSVSKDGLTYTFELRSDVKFSDGTPLTADVVKQNLVYRDQGDSAKGIPRKAGWPEGATYTADDATNTVTVKLKEPYAPFLSLVANFASGILAPKFFTLTADQQADPSNWIGTGPFHVTQYVANEKLVLTRTKGYAWAPRSSYVKNQGEAYLDTVTELSVPEDAVRLGTLESGQADVLRYVQPSEESRLASKGYQVLAFRTPSFSPSWYFQLTAPYVDDIRVRRAILHAIDRQKIVDQLYSSSWNASTGLFNKVARGYTDQSKLIAYEPDTSDKLLDEAGWTSRNADGYRTKDGKELTISTYVDVYDHTAKAKYQAVQQQLKQIGVHLDVKQVDYSTYPTAITDPSVGLIRGGGSNNEPGLALAQNVWADVFKLDGSDKKLVELTTAETQATTDAARTKALDALQDYVVEQAYYVPILEDTQTFVAQSYVHGVVSSRALPSFASAWLSK